MWVECIACGQVELWRWSWILALGVRSEIPREGVDWMDGWMGRTNRAFLKHATTSVGRVVETCRGFVDRPDSSVAIACFISNGTN